MRIVHVYKDYFPVLGGIENHVRVLAEGQVVAGHDVSVVACALGHRTRRHVESGVSIVRAARIGTLRSMPLSLAYGMALREVAADVIHVHSPFPLGEQAALARQTPIVVTHHSDVVKQKLLLRFYAPLYRRFLKRVSQVIVTSAAYAQTSPWLAPHAAKCRVVPLGIDADAFAPGPVEPSAQTDLLFAGKLRYYKGLDDLLLALQQLDGVRLTVVGDGPLRQRLETLATTPALTGRVRFLGEISDAELPLHYRSAKLFVLPANCRAEAFGTVLLEAMAAGLPCITTELGTGTSWVVQDGVSGKIVPPRDPDALARAIRELLDDPATRHRMGDAGRRRVLETFTTDRMAEGVQAVYREATTRTVT